ncbi:hypothetical protein TDB9533_01541 [Thalassocella blandensis]|nr:hypothetical protein TDB9533_01541 [Thalassocella blandensis]
MTMINKKLLCLSVACAASMTAWSAAGISIKQCQQEAKSQMEISYCAILEKAGPSGLPNFHQFRQNPAKMQKLLLKNPARKAGIELPEEVSSNSQSPLKPTPVITAPPEPAPSSTATSHSPQQDRKQLDSMTFPNTGNSTGTASSTALAGCSLNQTEIVCDKGTYNLQSNLTLQQLTPDVLTDENRLEFPDRQANESILQYLSRVYPLYIEKMLLLGLGDTTMSFTKFNAMFHETVKQGLSFKRRFRDMYELLKKERKTQAIKARYNDLLPESINNCMPLNAQIITCDNVKQNWVYQQQ